MFFVKNFVHDVVDHEHITRRSCTLLFGLGAGLMDFILKNFNVDFERKKLTLML